MDKKTYSGRELHTMAEYELSKFDGKPTAIIWRKEGQKETQPCPFCGDTHVHGMGTGGRVAHCATDSGKDLIVAVDGTILSRNRGYVIKEYRLS